MNYYFPGELDRLIAEHKRMVWKGVRAVLWTVAICFFIFTSFGYWWHYQTIKNDLRRYENLISHYRDYQQLDKNVEKELKKRERR